MAGVDLDTSVLDPVIGVNKPPGRRSLSVKFRVSRHGLEERRESKDCMAAPQDYQLKYEDHWLIKVIGRTLNSLGISYIGEELCQEWTHVDLKKRKKSLDGDESDKGPSKKKSKSSSKTKHSKISFKVTHKPPKDPMSSNAVEPIQNVSDPTRCTEAPAKVLMTNTPPSKTHIAQEIHGSATEPRMINHSTQANLDVGCGMHKERGVQCKGAPLGPASLEGSLAHVHECLAAVSFGQQKTSKALYKEGRDLQARAHNKSIEDNAVSIEVVLMKLRACLKYLEASIHAKDGTNRRGFLRRIGDLLFTVAKSADDKMESNDFVRACFSTLAQRLGVCAYMQYAQHAKKGDDEAMAIIQQAVEIAASTTKTLADLHEQATTLYPHTTAAIVLAESILKNCGLGPLRQHVYIAGKAMDELEKAKL